MNLLTTSSSSNNNNKATHHDAASSLSSFKIMNENFTLLSQQRRNFDVVLSKLRSEFSKMESTLTNLLQQQQQSGNSDDVTTTTSLSSSSAVIEESVVILSAEVDCHRRTLDALSRLYDEKQTSLDRHRDEYERNTRKLRNNLFLSSSTSAASSSSSLLDQIEELRQTEQRIRDLEDIILSDDTNTDDFPAVLSEEVAERKEKEKYLRLMIQNSEKEMTKLDARLRQVSKQDGEDVVASDKNRHQQQQESSKMMKKNQQLLLRKGALQSKLDQKKSVVQRLNSMVEQIPKHLRTGTTATNSAQQQPHQNNFFNKQSAASSSLSASVRSYLDAHRLISLVKASVCHLQENFDEISSTITRYSVEKSLIIQRIQQQQEAQEAQQKKKLGRGRKHQNDQGTTTLTDDNEVPPLSLEMWTQDELYQILEEIQELTGKVLERNVLMNNNNDDSDEQSSSSSADDSDDNADDSIIVSGTGHDSDNDDEEERQRLLETQSSTSTTASVSKHKSNHQNKNKKSSSSLSVGRKQRQGQSSSTKGLDDLLKSIRKLTVFIDIMETSLGKRAVFEQLRFADDEFNLLPQLLQITQTTLEVREEIINNNNTNTSSSSTPSTSASRASINKPQAHQRTGSGSSMMMSPRQAATRLF